MIPAAPRPRPVERLRFTTVKVRLPVLVVAAIGATFIALLAVPRGRNLPADTTAENPASEALRLYDAFIERATAGSTHEAEDSGSISPASGLPRLRRDLFRPQKGAVAPILPVETAGDSLSAGVSGLASRPAPPAESPSPRIPRLEGIFIDGRSAVAVINGRVVAEGDTVAGGFVIQIEPRGATWLSPEQTYVRLPWRQTP